MTRSDELATELDRTADHLIDVLEHSVREGLGVVLVLVDVEQEKATLRHYGLDDTRFRSTTFKEGAIRKLFWE